MGGDCCVNLEQQCLCLTCKQDHKDIPACTHLHVERKHWLVVLCTFQGPTVTDTCSSLCKKLQVKQREL